MREQLAEALKISMKALDKRRTATLRLVHAAIKDRDIACGAHGKERITDPEIVDVLAKMIKQRRESAGIYEKAGRAELATQEKDEIAIIEEFLPRQLDEAQTLAAVKALIAELGAHGLKDMGRTMAALKQRHAGEIDVGRASALVKDLLK